MSTKYYRNSKGEYLGAFSGYQPDPLAIVGEDGTETLQEQEFVYARPPKGAIEVSMPPDDARQIYADGVWIWTEEVLAADAVDKRNALLLESDWINGFDVPEAVKSAWTPYRQALRDLTEQEEFPTNIAWPKAPL